MAASLCCNDSESWHGTDSPKGPNNIVFIDTGPERILYIPNVPEKELMSGSHWPFSV